MSELPVALNLGFCACAYHRAREGWHTNLGWRFLTSCSFCSLSSMVWRHSGDRRRAWMLRWSEMAYIATLHYPAATESLSNFKDSC